MPRTLGDDAKKILGSNLREARRAHGWSQGAAAERAGVLRTRLNRWEKGHETLGTEGLLRLAIAYACPIDNLLGGVDEDYDAIIERRIPVDAQQHYKAKLNKLKALTLEAMELTVAAVGTGGPTPVEPRASSRSARGTSSRARALRPPKKR